MNANPLDPLAHDTSDPEAIYSPKIALSYTPPVPLPAPFPKTLHVEGKSPNILHGNANSKLFTGLPLYLASSVFVRHTLNALYSELQLDLTKVIVNTPKSSPALVHRKNDEPHFPLSRKRTGHREKSVLVGFRVTGTSRVSGGHGEWDV